MDEKQRTDVFLAQTENVRELETAWLQVNRQINLFLLKKKTKAAEINTKLLALIYCALAETLFSKLIHIPHGLELPHIDQIKTSADTRGIKNGWLKCAELGMQRVPSEKSSHGQNVLKKLSDLIERYIYDPSILRNKLAHGQWVVALNRDNTLINTEITREIASNTVIELYRRKHALEKLAAILEDIIKSPGKTHHRDYWQHLVELEQKQDEMLQWTVVRKVDRLVEKKRFALRPN